MTPSRQRTFTLPYQGRDGDQAIALGISAMVMPSG